MIEIKKYYIALAVSCMLFSFVKAEGNVETPAVVSKYYESIKILPRISSNNELQRILLDMKKSFMHYENSGINLPNDFKDYSFDKKSISHENKTLTSNTYVEKLGTYLQQRQLLNVEYKVVRNWYEGALPDVDKRKLSSTPAYVVSVVNKTYSSQEIRRNFQDTIKTLLSENKISEVNGGSGNDVEDLRLKAAKAYSLGQYRKAYELFEEIIKIAPKDADTYYRLGIMTYWLQGCEYKFIKKKYAREKAKEYWNQSLLLAKENYVLREKIYNIQFNTQYYNQ